MDTNHVQRYILTLLLDYVIWHLELLPDPTIFFD